MVRADDNTYPVSLEHMAAFGTIIQWFARHEQLIQIAMAGITKSELMPMLALTSGHGYAGKKDALESLLHFADSLTASQIEKLRSLLGELHQYNRLRNSIAHCCWIESDRPNAIKPIAMVVRGGSGKIVGLGQDEKDYTVEELFNAANELGRLYNDFSQFLDQNELFKAIAEKIVQSHFDRTPPASNPPDS